jgi:hypothetical protein
MPDPIPASKFNSDTQKAQLLMMYSLALKPHFSPFLCPGRGGGFRRPQVILRRRVELYSNVDYISRDPPGGGPPTPTRSTFQGPPDPPLDPTSGWINACPVARCPPPEHAVIHPEVGSGVGSRGTSLGGIVAGP